jgi:hypothetical protein
MPGLTRVFLMRGVVKAPSKAPHSDFSRAPHPAQAKRQAPAKDAAADYGIVFCDSHMDSLADHRNHCGYDR